MSGWGRAAAGHAHGDPDPGHQRGDARATYALVALGFHLIYRATDVLDFAQGDKVVVGGLVGLSLVQADVPMALTFVLVAFGGLVAGLVYDQFVIGPTLRRGTEASVIATVGALLVLGSGHVLSGAPRASRSRRSSRGPSRSAAPR